ELTRDWTRDVNEALALEPPHISLYGLTVEAHTPLARWVARGAVSGVAEDCYESEFLWAHDQLAAHGYGHYEVSNYARPGHESRHNSAYWNGAQYLGLGPSAHSFDGSVRRWNIREYQAWKRAIAAGDDPLGGSEVLTDDQRTLERVYLGLRSRSGLTVDAIPPEIVEKWREQQWAEVDAGRLRLTPHGWLRLDALVGALTAHSNPC
ncbi:MAG: coproporphyrinogen III oxidase, partial [Gemmatimonadota bacterium]